MSVPTHNLYEFISQVLENRYWIKYFFEWGNKDLTNCIDLVSNQSIKDIYKPFEHCATVDEIFGNDMKKIIDIKDFQPVLICHDQEPLNFDLYLDKNINKEIFSMQENLYGFCFVDENLRQCCPDGFQNHWLILHSELNSPELDKYECTKKFIGVYWWSHAIISLDWYRFAKYDKNLKKQKTQKRFLIYARALEGTRSYRKILLDKIQHSLVANFCQIGSFDCDVSVDSDASAIYNAEDFAKTDISVVLETVFDSRIHLTEKTLRPIACGHPFVLVAGPGSLEYIRKYGFKTFSPWINEEYDKELDTEKRLQKIYSELERLSNLNEEEFSYVIKECVKIADYNKQVFFSKKSFNHLIEELVKNAKVAANKIQSTIDVDRIKFYYENNLKFRNTKRWEKQKPYILSLIDHLEKGSTLEDYVPPDLD